MCRTDMGSTLNQYRCHSDCCSCMVCFLCPLCLRPIDATQTGWVGPCAPARDWLLPSKTPQGIKYEKRDKVRFLSQSWGIPKECLRCRANVCLQKKPGLEALVFL